MSFQPPHEIELIRQMARENLRKPPVVTHPLPDDDQPEFLIKTGHEWLQYSAKQGHAQRLFDDFWFQNELCILFADTNAGKSILAVQIGDSISRGEPVGSFRLTAGPEKVLYFDFELNSQQFRRRYNGNEYGDYQFNPNFMRAVLNPLCNRTRKFKKYEEFIINALENALINTKAKVLIIDNLTSLRYNTHAATGALNLLLSLQALKTKYRLSILVLAHTPKRNPAKPLSRDDLQGSKMLINFADSAFAIGESQHTPGQRYLKQIKQRSSAQTYGAPNICLCNIIKPYNFLQFEFPGNASEADHLMPRTEQSRRYAETQIAVLHQQGHTIRQIAEQLYLAPTTVHRILKRLQAADDG
jgi:hypothetical protein